MGMTCCRRLRARSCGLTRSRMQPAYTVFCDMEDHGLVRSHIDSDSKAGMGKRVFEITEEGRACMHNWVNTLEEYRRGIDQVIVHLREALAESPRPAIDNREASCCAHKAAER